MNSVDVNMVSPCLTVGHTWEGKESEPSLHAMERENGTQGDFKEERTERLTTSMV